MLEGFQCPDGDAVLVEDCLNKCRLEERCLTLPTLKLISQEREAIIWGCPSCGRTLSTLDKDFQRVYNIRYGKE